MVNHIVQVQTHVRNVIGLYATFSSISVINNESNNLVDLIVTPVVEKSRDEVRNFSDK